MKPTPYSLLRYKIRQFAQKTRSEGFSKAFITGTEAAWDGTLGRWKRKIYDERFLKSFASLGEDLDSIEYLGYVPRFYVDIGANDPIEGNMTYGFYIRGSSGISIEPNHDLVSKFAQVRPRDLNLGIGLGPIRGVLHYFRFENSVLNTFIKERAAQVVRLGFALKDDVEVPVHRLDEILREHAGTAEIDFLSVDAEGFDLDILTSNDWNVFRPKIVLVEHEGNDRLDHYLSSVGYRVHKLYKKYGSIANAMYVDATNEKRDSSSSAPGSK